MLTKRQLGTSLSALILIAAFLPAAVYASSPLGIGTAEPSFNTGGFGGPFLVWVNYQQQTFYRELTGALSAMRSDPWKLWTLVSLSFIYGIFHAAGPGHGKAVISSYMIANEIQLKRGILISFISSMLQAVTAILVVGAAYLVLRGTSISMTNATDFLEMISYLLVAGFGFWLLVRKARSLFTRSNDHGHSHAHTDVHDHAHHHHHETADFCEECGHAHIPAPHSLGGERFSLKEAFSAVLAVGLRPCSGAIIVLTFSLLNSLYLGGTLSVFAMAIGTAITVSTLAITAVSAKGIAVRVAGDGTLGVRVGYAIEILGAFLVMALGIILFLASMKI